MITEQENHPKSLTDSIYFQIYSPTRQKLYLFRKKHTFSLQIAEIDVFFKIITPNLHIFQPSGVQFEKHIHIFAHNKTDKTQ